MYLSTVHLCTVKFTRKSNRDKRLACFYGFSSDPDDRLQSPLQVVRVKVEETSSRRTFGPDQSHCSTNMRSSDVAA